MPRNKYAFILGNLGNTRDRFMGSGYKEDMSPAAMLRQASSIKGVKGVELVGNWDVTKKNLPQIKRMLVRNNLVCASVIPDLFSKKLWGNGSFCSRSARVRRLAADEVRNGIDIARELGCGLVNLWLGQDGYDYILQADFQKQRGWMTDALGSLAEQFPDMRFSLEYKLREPRLHSFHARAADTLLMAMEIGLSNVGVCLDVGHALLAQENMAESAWMLHHYGGKLFHLHVNDNYRYCDDDMIVGSVHFNEYLELLFWLKEQAYDGWFSMDLYPYRENGLRAVSESVAFLRNLETALTDKRVVEIRDLLTKGDATLSSRWLRELILGG